MTELKLTTSTADTAHGPVQYVDRGSGSPVLVVHGSPGGCDQGSLMAEFVVAAGFRAVIPSRPGYLGTPLTTKNASIDAQADAHAELMASLGIDRFAVLCWSGGGPSAYRLAVRHADRVSALVALAGLSSTHHWHEPLSERFMFHTRLGKQVIAFLARRSPKQLIRGTIAAEGKLTKPQLADQTDSVLADQDKRRLVLEFALMASQVPPRREGVNNDKRNFANVADLQLSEITAPTLLVHGRVDVDVEPSYSEFAERQIPNVQVEWVELGGHLCAFIDRDSAAIQGRIVAFLRQHSEGSA